MLSFVINGFSMDISKGFFQSASLNEIDLSLSISRFQKGSLPAAAKSMPFFCLSNQMGLPRARLLLVRKYFDELFKSTPLMLTVKRVSSFLISVIAFCPFWVNSILPFSRFQVPSLIFGVSFFPQIICSCLNVLSGLKRMVCCKPSQSWQGKTPW